MLDQLIDISRRSWKQGTGNSLDQPGPNAFIRTLTELAGNKGWVSMWLIHVGDRALAMEYQLIGEGNVHALRADFDAGCEEISPGSHLFRQLLESLFGKGLSRYYMGPGDNPYKWRWTEDGEAMVKSSVYNTSIPGRLAALTDTVLKPAARRLRDRLRAPPAEAAATASGKNPEHAE